MARIVCVIPAMTGILHASLELARRLRAEGHEVILGCPWDIREKVERHGFEYMQFAPIEFDPTPAAKHGPDDGRVRRLVRTLSTVRVRRERAVEALAQREFAARIVALDVDLVLIDLELHEFVLPAVHRRLPVALLCQFFPLTKRPGLPPITSPLVPRPRGDAREVEIQWAWTWERTRRWIDRQKQSARSLFADRRAVLRRYARRTGFPLRRTRAYTFLQPWIYRGMPLLSLTDPALDFPHPPEPGVRSTGPMVFTERSDDADPDASERLDAIFAESDADGRRLVYCSVTTVGGADTTFLSRLGEVAARHPEWIFVVGLGGKLEPQALGPLPGNMYAFAWVPQLEALRRADLSINHGGINTIHECIHFGVPMLVYSGKKHDQNGCAARVVYHGLGLAGDKDVDGVDEIDAKVVRVLTEPSFRREIEAASARHRDYEARGLLGRVVAELLERDPTALSGP
jgi:UDP:flavonoid glycosyltransferase YjiC (YdhE family)